MRSRRSDSLAEHFDFDVVVHRLARGTVRIDAHVAALRELGVDRAAIVALAVLLVRALAELGGVVVVVVEVTPSRKFASFEICMTTSL